VRVARWKNDRQAAFLLMFDDSIPTDIKVVFPELKKRGFIGTFYVNPGRGEWKPYQEQWEMELPAAGMVYGNHTMTHQGVRDFADAEQEIGRCNDVILHLFPGKEPRLISFGLPGVPAGKWNISAEELRTLLAKYHLIERPKFDGHGAMVSLGTAEQMLALVDHALETGGMEHIVFHGVGGDWITTPTPIFLALLDGLAAREHRLWITDTISAQKYQTERETAECRLLESSDQQVRLSLTTKADPEFYDLPLTIIAAVPRTWTSCTIEGTDHPIKVQNGSVQFDTLPGTAPLTLRPTSASAAIPK